MWHTGLGRCFTALYHWSIQSHHRGTRFDCDALYIHRGPMVTSEIEPVLVMIQFYLCLGPCGARLSVDRLLALRAAQNKPASEKDSGEQKFFSATLATRLIQVHLCLIVAMMGLAKLAGPGNSPRALNGMTLGGPVKRSGGYLPVLNRGCMRPLAFCGIVRNSLRPGLMEL